MAVASTVCVYPLSPTYLVLHRYLYYLSLILSVLYPTPPPLVKGAFAFSLTYSSTAALYAILILALPLAPTTPILNLDILGLWAVLAPASILILPLLTWSRNLQGTGSKSARPIIRIWGILVLIGAACTFVLLQRAQSIADSVDASAVLNCQTLATDANAQNLRLRDPNYVLSVSYDLIFSPLYSILSARLVPLTFIPLAFGALSSLVTISLPIPLKSTGQASQLSASQGWAGGGLQEVSWSDSMSTSPLTVLRKAFLLLRRMVLYLTPGWLIPVMVVNELYLLRDWPLGIPEAESMYEVGQWGLFAGLGLVSAAAAVSWCAGGGGKDTDSAVRRIDNENACIA
jgi:hypothetical protein